MSFPNPPKNSIRINTAAKNIAATTAILMNFVNLFFIYAHFIYPHRIFAPNFYSLHRLFIFYRRKSVIIDERQRSFNTYGIIFGFFTVPERKIKSSYAGFFVRNVRNIRTVPGVLAYKKFGSFFPAPVDREADYVVGKASLRVGSGLVAQNIFLRPRVIHPRICEQ